MAQKVLATASTGTFQMATVANGARIYCSALDLTPYIGKLKRVKDTGGKYAWGYIKAADTTKAYGSNLFDADAAVFTAGTYAWTVYGANTIANVANSLEVTCVDGINGARENLNDAADLTADLVAGALYETKVDIKVNAGSSVDFGVDDGVIATHYGSAVTSETFITQTQEITSLSATGCYMVFRAMEAGEIAYLDNLSIRRITNLGPTAVLISSTPGGATQSWTGMETGFNPNSISTVEVLEPDFNILGAMTVLAWVKPDDGQPAAAQSILSKWDTTAHEAYDFLLLTTGKLKAVLTHDGATEWDHTTDAAVYADGAQSTFSHIGLVFDGAGNIDIFVNGVEVASTATGTPQNTIMDVAASFMMGKNTDGSPFAGSIASGVSISRALSAAEIANIYNRDKGRF